MSLLPERVLDEPLRPARSTRLLDAALREPKVIGKCLLVCLRSAPSRHGDVGTGVGEEEETVEWRTGVGFKMWVEVLGEAGRGLCSRCPSPCPFWC